MATAVGQGASLRPPSLVADRKLRAAGRIRGRARKAVRLVRRPAYWRQIVKGVAASVEHEDVDFRADVQTIVDVGASRGQFAAFALERFPDAHLICFEPLTAARNALVSWVPEPRVTVHPVALGEQRGEAVLHVSARDDSSSLLAIGARQVEAFPGTSEERKESIEVRTLDDYLSPDTKRPVLLKIDVQGFELGVLSGANRALTGVDEVFVECSFRELYEGQALADAVVCKLRERGFRLRGVYGVVVAKNRTCLQADFLFKRYSAGEDELLPRVNA